VLAILSLCLLVLLALGLAERVARDRALAGLPIRIHVNGTRAKSTVTRLVWSALLEAGIPAVAKTTGTAPRLLMPDGREVPLRRGGPANVREQLALARHAHRLGARAIVVECMAIEPGLQHVTERQMIRATIGVITNVRLDHTEIMGHDLDTIAGSLSNTIPERGVLVVSASPFVPQWRARASRLGTRLVVVESPGPEIEDAGSGTRWLAEDISLALVITRQVGIDDRVARAGFAHAPRDPGEMRQGVESLRRGDARWLDATAANDPESLAILIDAFEPWRDRSCHGDGVSRKILVYHHREDRAPRLDGFARHSDALQAADHVVVTGARPPHTVWRSLVARRAAGTTAFVATGRLAQWLAEHAAGAAVVMCGNTRGLDVPRLFEEAGSRD
jgi:poly-gamma-glutamate synthase PgsB/CapB